MTFTRPMFTLVTIFSCVLALANLITAIYLHKVLRKMEYEDVYGVNDNNLHREALPGTFQEVSMMVKTNHKFSLVDDAAWADILPGKRGLVRLGPNGSPFGTALYHQLHCVNALRFSYTVARDRIITDHQVLYSKIAHDNHCFQFIRQSILCKADSSLVLLDDTDGNQTLAISQAGFGSLHRCRNWAQIRLFILENDAKWDGIPYQLENDMPREGD